MPAASFCRTAPISEAFPILAYNFTFCPSRLIFSSPLSFCSSSCFSWYSACFSRYSFRVSSSGSMNSFPVAPSTMPIFPSYSSVSPSPRPMIAGIFIVRAKIAVWEFVEPPCVTKDSTISLSSCTVSLGAKSSEAKMTGVSVTSPPSWLPDRIDTTRSEMSFTSAARSRIYSSSIDANIWEKLSPVVPTANSALISCVVIIFVIAST